jgi:thymidylate kinase
MEIEIVVDGNDGTGKSTLVEALRERGFSVSDRGLPTRMTDDDALTDAGDAFYLVLDAPVEVCQSRLAQAGKDLSEQYHTREDLTHYRARFREVSRRLRRCREIDSSGTREQTLAAALRALEEAGIRADG